MDRSRPNPSLGLVMGLLTACGLTLVAVGLYLLDGPDRFQDVSLGGAIGTYFLAGALGGPLFGLVLPLTARREGGVLVGIAVALAVYFPISQLIPALATGALGAGLVGGIVGFVVWTPVATDTGENQSSGTTP